MSQGKPPVSRSRTVANILFSLKERDREGDSQLLVWSAVSRDPSLLLRVQIRPTSAVEWALELTVNAVTQWAHMLALVSLPLFRFLSTMSMGIPGTHPTIRAT